MTSLGDPGLDHVFESLEAIEHGTDPDEGEIVNGNGHGDREFASKALATINKALVPAGGTVGVQNAWGWYDETLAGGPDTNPELAGRLKYAAYREMTLTDPAVRSLYFMWTLPIRSAEYKVEPAENHPGGQAAAENEAEFARWQLGLEGHDGRLDLTWDQFLQQLPLMKLKYGAQGGELIPAFPPKGEPLETWTLANGEAKQIIPLARVMPIYASTISEIETETTTGQIKRIRQDLPGTDWIPGAKLVWFVNEREGASWFGTSALRCVYRLWTGKQMLIKAGLIAYDRWALGIPIIYHPQGKEKEAAAAGRNFRHHERAFGTFKGPKPTATDPGGGWEIDMLNGDIADPVGFLRYIDQQIAMAGLQHFSSLGVTETGSRAVADVLSGPYYLALKAVANDVVTEVRKQVLRPVFDWNFGQDTPLPKITVSKVEKIDIEKMARAVADLAAAGFSFTDVQNDVRDLFPLPHLPEIPDGVGIAPVEGGPVPAGAAA